ncbi:hypothetical protein G6F46_003576 [Rhizopus delemar]|uniref:Reverse transcriptase zinc-binding domain-containing protein n=2 Tax=Rhizopus TaxID=4842 RepID=A0A9P6Z8X0_9FUNG|nr:hypothetical protein G6F55_002393 [Rhizopus delemar]KAG1536263.1 hypothetical protein G6F51_011066 [Rhizopus arrhizus]KAG1501465.1 hypothetical protein G6F54_003019 [Rhizopus delemar]KAG1515037.1 hypothetical protein G6F53_003231 [Rhizopus delemar]KAG1519472.1 hypothetical protein G6F52_008588 [Rhizopus delemar]
MEEDEQQRDKMFHYDDVYNVWLMVAKDIFQFNSNGFESLQLWKSHIKEENFFTALRSTSDLSFGLFISSMGCPCPELKFHSLVNTLLPDGTPIENLSTKWFRHVDKLPLTSLSSHYPRANKSSWTQFWHASIPHPARTILWRLYHSKLPTRS